MTRNGWKETRKIAERLGYAFGAYTLRLITDSCVNESGRGKHVL